MKYFRLLLVAMRLIKTSLQRLHTAPRLHLKPLLVASVCVLVNWRSLLSCIHRPLAAPFVDIRPALSVIDCEEVLVFVILPDGDSIWTTTRRPSHCFVESLKSSETIRRREMQGGGCSSNSRSGGHNNGAEERAMGQ